MRSFLAKLSTVDERSLTKKELKIVEYIKTNIKKIVDENMRIESLAQEVGTGYSAIYGLLTKLEIKGYRDFSISLANDVDADEIAIAKDDENVMSGYISVIKQNYSLIEKRSLFDSLNLIRSAPRVFISHWESVLLGPALEIENFLFDQGKMVNLLDSDWDTICQRVNKINPGDLFLFYTKFGTSRHLEKIIEKIKMNGGNVIFISGRMPSISISKNVSSIHTLLVEGPAIEENIRISKSIPFHYFNDLLIYHYLHDVEQEK